MGDNIFMLFLFPIKYLLNRLLHFEYSVILNYIFVTKEGQGIVRLNISQQKGLPVRIPF